MVSGYPTFTNLPRVDGLSTNPLDLGRHSNLKVEIPTRLQGITFLVDCYKDNRMQGNRHYDILL